MGGVRRNGKEHRTWTFFRRENAAPNVSTLSLTPPPNPMTRPYSLAPHKVPESFHRQSRLQIGTI